MGEKTSGILTENWTLADGTPVPKLGLGTWFIDDDKAAEAVRVAVEISYRNIDTAQAYGNERGVGEVIRSCGLDRDRVFVSCKLAAEVKDHEAVASIDATLDRMGLDHLDLILIHSPQPWDDFRGQGNYDEGNLAAWRALEEARAAGKVRAIGVSNFQQHEPENILSNGTVPPAVNQVLAHVGNTPDELIAWCQERSILIEAYSPIAHGAILEAEEVRRIADRYHVSVPQLCSAT